MRTRKDVMGKGKVMSDLRLDLKVTGVARSGEMRTSYNGIDVSGDDTSELFADSDKVWAHHRITPHPPRSVTVVSVARRRKEV